MFPLPPRPVRTMEGRIFISGTSKTSQKRIMIHHGYGLLNTFYTYCMIGIGSVTPHDSDTFQIFEFEKGKIINNCALECARWK